MDFSELQQKILVSILYSTLTKSEKISIFYYLFYQLCWDFKLDDYLELKID